MSSATPADDALTSVLAADRPTPQRLQLLQTLRDELRGEKAVLALLSAAREEKTLDLRRAFLQHASACGITRITDRAAYIDAMLHFAAFDDERELRRIALSQLSGVLGHSPLVEDVLLETLVSELHLDTQRLALDALLSGKALRPENLQTLLDFIPRSPAALRASLIDLLVKFDADAVQRGLVAFLEPAESPEIRGRALSELAALPRLQHETLRALESLLLNEPSSALQEQVAAVLRDNKQINPELFKILFALFLKYPDRTGLLEGMRHRLASFPALLPAICETFRSIRSAQLRVRILRLLEKTPSVPLFISALSDTNPQVRSAALDCCAHHHAKSSDAIEAAVLAAAKVESVVALREACARVFVMRTRRAPEIDRGIVAWLDRETEPRVERVLAETLPAIPLSSENGRAILRAYGKILLDPATSSARRAEIVARLRDAAFADAPELAGCLRQLLERSSSIEEVDTLYARLRELQPDAGAHADLLLTLFFRFAADYPRAPLDGWLRDFQALAPVNERIRAQIPVIVRMTGASWLTGSAETAAQKSILLPALMEQIRRGNWIESGRLLREAWENRTIRKSDMLAFFKKLLRMPGEDSLMLSCLVMMAKGGLATPEVFDLCFGYILENSRNGSYTPLLRDFLQGKNQDSTPMRSINEVRVGLEPARKQDPAYRERVFAAFTQRNLDRYWRGLPEELDFVPPPDNWNNWEYQLWPDKGNDWPIAQMFFALKPYDRIAALLKSHVSPTPPRSRSIQYLLLLHLWQELADNLAAPVLDDILRGVGELMRKTNGRPGFELLHDRAVLVFQKYWTRQINSHTGGRAVAPDLADLAAENYIALCGISAQFDCAPQSKFPAVLPKALHGMNAARVEALRSNH